jgi:hypothetical protein
MYQRLRILLAAFSVAPASRLRRLSPWIIRGFLCLLLLVADGALAVVIWLVWPLVWPLVRATGGLLVGDVGSAILGISPMVLQLMAITMVFTTHSDFADDIHEAAQALRRAVAAQDPIIAPPAPADAPATMDAQGFSVALPDTPLTVAIPALLMVSRLSITLLLATGVTVALLAAGMLAAIPLGLGVSLARVFTDSEASADQASVRTWLLRYWCHRTGKWSQEALAPLYRLRSALSRLWLAYAPAADCAFQNSG